MYGPIPAYGTFSFGKKTATAATAFARLIPGYRPTSGAPVVSTSVPDPLVGAGITRVKNFVYQITTTAHVITVMRPLNYTTLSADAAASQAVVNITADPGLFQTSGRYLYAKPGTTTAPSAANNGIAASDYVAYQAANGQWVVDTVASVSSLAVTLTANLPTGGVLKGSLLYFFGITTDVDPATNEAHMQFDILPHASATQIYTLQSEGGLWNALHPGDPLLFYSPNTTAQGWFELISGEWTKH